MFKDQDILDRKAARDLIDEPDREFVKTDTDVTDNAFIWRIPTNELGDLNLPFSSPVTAALIIEPGIEPKSGDWVIVTDADNNIMVKRFEKDMPHTYLHSLKSKHEPFKMDESYIINGVVTNINLKTR